MIKRSLGGMAMSLAELIIGILLLVNPIGFTSGIIVTFGLVMMLWGICRIIQYFCTDPEEAAVARSLEKGLTELLVGAFCAFHSRWFLVTFPVLTLVYGVVILLSGLKKLQWMMDFYPAQTQQMVPDRNECRHLHPLRLCDHLHPLQHHRRALELHRHQPDRRSCF